MLSPAGGNFISGSIPTEVGELTDSRTLEFCKLWPSYLEVSFSWWIAFCCSSCVVLLLFLSFTLRVIAPKDNNTFTGNIPIELYNGNMTRLRSLDFRELSIWFLFVLSVLNRNSWPFNFFVGCFLSVWLQNKNKELNELSGTIPPELGVITTLQTLGLGTFPSGCFPFVSLLMS